MTNAEKYKEAIRKITSKGDNFAKVKGVLVPCAECIICDCCDFHKDYHCITNRMNWLVEEAVEEIDEARVEASRQIGFLRRSRK